MAAASPAAISRASFFACLRRDSRDGRAGRALGAVIATSFHVPPVPAESRLKEGANAHNSDQNRWECSLAAGRWRPVSALSAVSRTAASMSNAIFLQTIPGYVLGHRSESRVRATCLGVNDF